MRGCAPRPAGDLRGAVVGQLDPEQRGGPGQHELQLGRLVELHLPDEAEPVAQRPGEQPGPRRRPDQGERVDLERDRGRTGPLADDDVDPEVLHRHVQQFLGGPGDAVDLVDEEDVAVREVRQHRGEVAGALDRRTAGDLHRRAELRADDQREAGLAQPGRAGEQHVVRRPAAPLGSFEHEVELAGDLGLPDEVVQRVRAQRRLDDALLVTRLRRHRPLLADVPVDLGGHRPVERVAHDLPSSWSARRSRTATSTDPVAVICSSATGPSWTTAPSASLMFQPRPTRADDELVAPRRDRRDRRAGRGPARRARCPTSSSRAGRAARAPAARRPSCRCRAPA